MAATPEDVSILIVDDDVAFGDAITRLLYQQGYAALLAQSGLEGLVTLRERKFKVILCDLRLPFLAGEGFYNELVDQYPDQAGRVVFVTGLPPDDHIRNFAQATGRPILHKPVEARDLLAVIRRISAQP